MSPRPFRQSRTFGFTIGLLAAVLTMTTDLVSAGEDDHLFGDWSADLAERGIDLQIGWDTASAGNLSGGSRKVIRYADNWKFSLGLDLERLWGWSDTTFQLVYTERNGRNAGDDADLGIYGSTQELYGRGQTLLLTRMWLEHRFFDGALQLKAGRVNLDDDFALAPCNFQTLQLCSTQPGQLYGGFWLNWPLSVWGSRLRWNLSPALYLQTGVYQVNPRYTEGRYQRSNGWWPDNPSGTTGMLVPLELVWQPTLGGLPGSYKFGVYDSSGGGTDVFTDLNGDPLILTGVSGRERSDAYGGYVTLSQQITGDAGGHGATVIVRATQGDRYTSAIIRQVTLSIEQRGLFGRPRDGLGFGVAATDANPRLARAARLLNDADPGADAPVLDSEYMAELYYNYSPAGWLNLRPNLQYFVNPGADSRRHDAFVVGLKTSVSF